MSIAFTRWTLIVAIVGLIAGGVGVQVYAQLTGAEVALDDTIIGALCGALLTIVGHYFPRG